MTNSDNNKGKPDSSDFNERGLPPLKINIPMPAIKPPKQNSGGKK